ncbi:unnamed protein product [Lactuca saligna]|uniref:Uncharacterized protein n=1 Tax=Lactuca saligna TaxID=75948 RepID=A0AA35ZS47_LACSI|nr:unnamed protein product [Lactuca saligna]
MGTMIASSLMDEQWRKSFLITTFFGMAGATTIADARIRDLPIILNDYIADQEVGNVSYVVENGYEKFSTSPKKIAEIVGEWFGPKAHELKTMIGLDLNLNYHRSIINIEY